MGQVTKDNARRKGNAPADDFDEAGFDAFMSALFGGTVDNPAMQNVGAIMEKIDEYFSKHYGAGPAEGEIDVRAHLIESELTVKTPPDMVTVAALRALADALEWAINETSTAATAQGDGARL